MRGAMAKTQDRLRPPAYVNIKTLAAELEISESQVYSLVNAGVLPKPIRLTSGCVRWSWDAVRVALDSMASGNTAADDADPFMRGIENAAKTQKDRRTAA